MKWINAIFQFIGRASLWLLRSPFRFLGWLISPVTNWIKKGAIYRFLNEVPEDRPVSESIATAFEAPNLFLNELEAARKHLLRSVLFLVASILVSLTFTQQIIAFLAQPIGGVQNLQAIEVTESIGVFMKVALLAGISIATPYLTFEIWFFFAPGIMPRARKLSLLSIPLAFLFFLAGIGFAYFVFLPGALQYLLDFMGVSTKLRPQSYFDFLTSVLFWIGISFEFPLIIFGISTTGILKPGMLFNYWRFAVVIIAILAAMVTPTIDPVNMGLVMAPLIVLYFVSILFSWVANLAIRPTQP